MTVLIVSAVIGFILAGAILYLVRRDHLHGSYAVWWLAVASVTLLLAVFPHIIDWLGNTLGIAYPPILAIVIGMAFTLIRMLQMDIDRSRQERALRRLTQRIAILDQELDAVREKTSTSTTSTFGEQKAFGEKKPLDEQKAVEPRRESRVQQALPETDR